MVHLLINQWKMNSEELDFLEQQLSATELLYCAACKEETLHVHLEVEEKYANGSEVLMQCTQCQATQVCLLPD